jgi:RHS repeat-associated protein
MIVDTDSNLLFAAAPLYGGTMALSYNSRNQLLSAAVGGVSGSFTYDAEGHRQSATHAGQTSTFTVNPAAELSQVLVRQVEGGQRTWAVYGLGLLYEVEIESVGEPVYTLVEGDMMMLVSQVTERLRVHHYDQTGNTVAITDGQGRDVLWVQYDAYGAVVHAESPTRADGGAPVRPEVNALPDGMQRALAVTPWLYVGEHGVMTDPTGLLHMRARYYHPGLRRFLNADPIQFEGGMNWYGYAGGNPVMGMDPLGLFGMENVFGGVKAIAGAIETFAGVVLVTGGVATSQVGIGFAGIAGGTVVAGHGVDTFQAGMRQMWNGKPTDTFTSRGLQAVGMSRRAANLTDAGIGIFGTFGASAGSSALARSEGLVHLTSSSFATSIGRSGELIGSNYAGPASNALRNGWSVTAATGLAPGTYAAVAIPAAAQSAFTAVRGIGPVTSWQASMGQVYTASGTLTLSTGAFARMGTNMGQATFYGVDALFTGARVAGSLCR